MFSRCFATAPGARKAMVVSKQSTSMTGNAFMSIAVTPDATGSVVLASLACAKAVSSVAWVKGLLTWPPMPARRQSST
jgi:hypothetical protein